MLYVSLFSNSRYPTFFLFVTLEYVCTMSSTFEYSSRSSNILGEEEWAVLYSKLEEEEYVGYSSANVKFSTTDENQQTQCYQNSHYILLKLHATIDEISFTTAVPRSSLTKIFSILSEKK